jgi:hypothetical protein
VPALSSDTTPHYLGPVIIAQTNRPVRVKFTNNLTAANPLFHSGRRKLHGDEQHT